MVNDTSPNLCYVDADTKSAVVSADHTTGYFSLVLSSTDADTLRANVNTKLEAIHETQQQVSGDMVTTYPSKQTGTDAFQSLSDTSVSTTSLSVDASPLQVNHIGSQCHPLPYSPHAFPSTPGPLHEQQLLSYVFPSGCRLVHTPTIDHIIKSIDNPVAISSFSSPLTSTSHSCLTSESEVIDIPVCVGDDMQCCAAISLSPSPPPTIPIDDSGTVLRDLTAKPLRVSLFINHTYLDFILDTGSNISCIHSCVARHLSLLTFPTFRKAVAANAGELDLTSQTIAPVQFTRSQVYSLPMYVVNNLTCHGLIGMDLYNTLIKQMEGDTITLKSGEKIAVTHTGQVRAHVQMSAGLFQLNGGRETTEPASFCVTPDMVGVYSIVPSPTLPPHLHVRHAVYYIDGEHNHIPITILNTSGLPVVIRQGLLVGELVRIGERNSDGSCHQVSSVDPDLLNSIQKVIQPHSTSVHATASVPINQPHPNSKVPKDIVSTHGPLHEYLSVPHGTDSTVHPASSGTTASPGVGMSEVIDTGIPDTDTLSDEESMKAADAALNETYLAHLPVHQRNELRQLLLKHHRVFNGRLGVTTLTQHHIETGNAEPIAAPIYRQSYYQDAEIRKAVTDMLALGVIRVSNSPWSAPIVLSKKKDGGVRFCTDYRKLNSITKHDATPLPLIQSTINQLGHNCFFTTLDLLSGYWQIAMHPNSIEKTAFSTADGHYEYLRMPFGLTTAPATFQKAMNILFSTMLYHNMIVYLDDLLIYSSSWKEHMVHLDSVLAKLESARLKAKLSKCHFALPEVVYVGHLINAKGVQPDPRLVSAVHKIQPPATVRQVRAFLGLCSYYRRFIRDFAKESAPLNHLLHNNVKFEWTRQCQKAFEYLKLCLTSNPIVCVPDFSKQFIVYADASVVALGAVLAQVLDDGHEHVIAYASRTLNQQETRYGITELECLGVVYALKQFHQFIYGTHFLVVTDHSALVWLHTMRNYNSKLMRWSLQMQPYSFSVLHKSGITHKNVDGLSRVHSQDIDASPNLFAQSIESMSADSITSFMHEILQMAKDNTTTTVVTSPSTATANVLSISDPLKPTTARRQLTSLNVSDPSTSTYSDWPVIKHSNHRLTAHSENPPSSSPRRVLIPKLVHLIRANHVVPTTSTIQPELHWCAANDFIAQIYQIHGNDDYTDEQPQEYEVEKIVKHRGTGTNIQYLVKWVGYPSSENTWQTLASLEHSPDLVATYNAKHRIDTSFKLPHVPHTDSDVNVGDSDSDDDINSVAIGEDGLDEDDEMDSEYKRDPDYRPNALTNISVDVYEIIPASSVAEEDDCNDSTSEHSEPGTVNDTAVDRGVYVPLTDDVLWQSLILGQQVDSFTQPIIAYLKDGIPLPSSHPVKLHTIRDKYTLDYRGTLFSFSTLSYDTDVQSVGGSLVACAYHPQSTP
jgi:hypothetical protein